MIINLIDKPTNINLVENGHISLFREGNFLKNLDEYLQEVKWSDLRSMRDNKKLVPGQNYRIFDYKCTFSGFSDTAVCSAATHRFDIIVQAASENKLFEEAKAIQHVGFIKILSGNNDTVLFARVENVGTTSGYPWVIVTDSTNKEIYEVSENSYTVGSTNVFTKSEIPCISGTCTDGTSTFTILDVGEPYFYDSKLEAWDLKYCLDNDSDRFTWANSVNGKGVIYYMKDEWDNECIYDFKNILFPRYKISSSTKLPSLIGRYAYSNQSGCFSINTGATYWCYTFSYISGNTIYDVSTKRIFSENFLIYNWAFKNKIGCVYDSRLIDSLPNVVFVTDNTLCNDIYEFCGYYSNKVGGYTWNCTFGNDCIFNVIEDCVSDVVCGEHFMNNYLTFVGQSAFCTDCRENDIRNSIKICFRNDARDNRIFNCDTIQLYEHCINNILEGYLTNVFLHKNYTSGVIIEPYNSYIILTTSQTTSSSMRLQNIKIAQGSYTSQAPDFNTLTISHPTVNDAYQTTYQGAGSQIISI